jgi:hypothetical protein
LPLGAQATDLKTVTMSHPIKFLSIKLTNTLLTWRALISRAQVPFPVDGESAINPRRRGHTILS